MICTGHGPVLVGDRIKAVMKQYREWSTVVNPNPKKTVIIPYVSAYGYTKSLAEKIAEGVRDSGDIDVRSYDMVEVVWIIVQRSNCDIKSLQLLQIKRVLSVYIEHTMTQLYNL